MAGKEDRGAAVGSGARNRCASPWRTLRLHGLSASSSILLRWPLAVVSLLILLQGAYGNEITQLDPVRNELESEHYVSFQLSNDDNGAIYDSYEFYALQSLADVLYSLPHNQTNYVEEEDLMDDWRVRIRGPYLGEVESGWNENFDSVGKLTLTHNEGWIDYDYDGWYAEQQDPDQNEMYITCFVPDSQLDGNGDGWFEWDTNDYTVVLSDPESSAMGVAHEGIYTYSASGHEYELKRNGSIVRLLEVSLKRTNTELYVSLQISCDSTLLTTNYLEKRVLGSNRVWQELRSWVGQEGTTNITDELTNGSSGAQYRMRSVW